MNLSYETFSIFLLLIPGFISSRIMNLVVVRRDVEGLSSVIEALIFSFVIYVCISFLYGQSPVSLIQSDLPDGKSYGIRFLPEVMIVTFGLSIVLPLILGVLETHDLHMRFLRWAKVTHKSARSTTWLDVFIDQNRFLIVNLSDGRRVAGWPMYYSDNPQEGLIYLKDPSWVVDRDGEPHYIEIDIHGMFLVKKDNIESIEFTNTSIENVKLTR